MKIQGLLYICLLDFVAALQISLPSMTTQSTQPPLWDAHAHLQLNLEDANIELTKLPLGHRVGLMSVEESCWDRIASLLDGPHANKLRGAYGIHPWFAHHVPMNDSTWLVKLRARLMTDPSAIVGEIGLDAQWVPPPVAHPHPRRFGRKLPSHGRLRPSALGFRILRALRSRAGRRELMRERRVLQRR